MCVCPSRASGANPSDSQKAVLAGAALTVTSPPALRARSSNALASLRPIPLRAQWDKGTLLGRPLFQRAESDVTLPTGKYDSTKLANPGFLAKARAEVVEEQREREADVIRDRDRLRTAYDRLAAN